MRQDSLCKLMPLAVCVYRVIMAHIGMIGLLGVKGGVNNLIISSLEGTTVMLRPGTKSHTCT